MTNTMTSITPVLTPQQTYTLRESVNKALSNYFSKLGGQMPSDIYNMVVAEVEAPLIEAVMAFYKGNQSKAALVLGVSRSTLRKKLKQYHMD